MADSPHNARCHRCERPIKWTRRDEEPMVCGNCLAKIKTEGGEFAVRWYHAGMRGGK